MNKRSFFSVMRMGLVVITASGFVYGCGDSKPKNNPMIKKSEQRFKQATTLKGLVSDDKSPLKAGELKVFNAKNRVIATTQLEANGHYKVEIPAGTPLPILLTVYPESKDSKVEKLVAAVVYTSMTKFDINSLSTKIAKKAKQLGGYTHGNMVLAAESMVAMPDKNKTTGGFRGDPTKQYGGWH